MTKSKRKEAIIHAYLPTAPVQTVNHFIHYLTNLLQRMGINQQIQSNFTMQIKHFSAAALLLATFGACTSNEIGNSRDVAPETVYQQYSIRYNESDGKLDLHAQFRFGGRTGTTLVLNSPSNISFDGKPVQVDSSNMGGAFYKLVQAAETFSGSHRYTFTDINGKKYENSFLFEPLRLNQIPTTASRRQPLLLSFDGNSLREGDEITIGTTGADSSFSITHTVSGTNYTAEIPVKELVRQKKDNLVLDITLQRSIPLQQQTQEGGQMELYQQMKAVKLRLTQ